MGLKNDIQELIKSEVIDQITADKIQAYYDAKKQQSGNQLIIAFSLLGAILVGLGIILIVAHNWDDFPKSIKTLFAFVPLVIGQVACLFVLFKKSESVAWREGSGSFLFFAVATSISLVAQIYNIPGGTGSFLFTWMLLCFPLIYLMRSSMVSLLYLIGTTAFGVYVGYGSSEDYRYFLMLALALPHYVQLIKNGKGNFLLFHHIAIGLSLTIMLGSLANESEPLIFVAYMALLGLFIQISKTSYFRSENPLTNAYQLLGFCGTMYIMYLLSFDWFWFEDFNRNISLLSVEGFVSILLISANIWLMMIRKKDWPFDLVEMVFLVFALLFFIKLNEAIPIVLINLLTLGIGIQTAWRGSRADHLGIVNLGLIIVAILVTCRFFDSDLSFVSRGILFVLVGVGFFGANYWMVKKRRANDQ